MKKITVKSSRGDYPILIGTDLLEKTGDLFAERGLQGKVMIVTQENVAARYLKKVTAALAKKKIKAVIHLVEDGERAKSQEELFKILNHLCNEDFERRDTVAALGGGVVGDLAGFAASVYLRGIHFANIPTTLLAQVDSSIGGKTGINLRQGKNLAGAFYPAKIVIADIRMLKTLPSREFHASLAEVVKYGMIHNAKFFEYLEKNTDKILNKDLKVLEKIVHLSAAIKAGVVSRDEYETRGERMILNFGHTFGHGFERALHFSKLLHGEAVSIGMVCAAGLAVRRKLFSKDALSRLIRLLQKFHLPTSLSGLRVDADATLLAMSHDKKKKAGKLRFVLPAAIGKVVIREDVTEAMMEEILVAYGALL